MSEPRRFRKKPVVIEAMQYRPDLCNCDVVAEFMGPFLRWRWEAAGVFGYASTRRAAASAARAALLASQGGAR